MDWIGKGLPFALACLLTFPAGAASLEEHLRRPEHLLEAGCPGGSLELPKRFFIVCYHTDWRIARWVGYHLTGADLGGDAERKNDFREDPDIRDENARSKLSDYRGTGYARGHQAPAEDFTRSVNAMSTTFLLSNMAPQTTSLNSGKWRVLEDQARKAAGAHRGAWIFTGSLFATERRTRGSSTRTFDPIDPFARSRTSKSAWIGKGRVAVPTHSFKAILIARADNTFVGHGFVMPNQRKRLPGDVPAYQVSIDEIERLTGIDLFAALDKDMQARLEADEPAWPPKRERRQ